MYLVVAIVVSTYACLCVLVCGHPRWQTMNRHRKYYQIVVLARVLCRFLDTQNKKHLAAAEQVPLGRCFLCFGSPMLKHKEETPEPKVPKSAGNKRLWAFHQVTVS